MWLHDPLLADDLEQRCWTRLPESFLEGEQAFEESLFSHSWHKGAVLDHEVSLKTESISKLPGAVVGS